MTKSNILKRNPMETPAVNGTAPEKKPKKKARTTSRALRPDERMQALTGVTEDNLDRVVVVKIGGQHRFFCLTWGGLEAVTERLGRDGVETLYKYMEEAAALDAEAGRAAMYSMASRLDLDLLHTLVYAGLCPFWPEVTLEDVSKIGRGQALAWNGVVMTQANGVFTMSGDFGLDFFDEDDEKETAGNPDAAA